MTLGRAERRPGAGQFELLGASAGERLGATLMDQEQPRLTGDSSVDLPSEQSGSHLRNSTHLEDINFSVRFESGFFQRIPKKSIPLGAILCDAYGFAFQILQSLECRVRAKQDLLAGKVRRR